MKTKKDKASRNLMIAILLGDGSISKNNSFRFTHCIAQQEYVEWKIQQLHNAGLRTCGLKTSVCSVGYNVGSTYCYTRLYMTPFIKTLRRIVYKPYKNIANIKLLNRLDAKGLAIWYMDDGHINIRRTKGKIHGFYVKISTCLPKEEAEVLVQYFIEKWNIKFYLFKEGKNTFSLCCGTHEGVKFINIIKKYVEEVPSMMYKISYDLSQRRNTQYTSSEVETGNTDKTVKI